MKELPKVYEPQQVESSIYEMWMENDCFKATPDPDKKPYSIVMPPPNVTGQLHMGHALDATLQDILTRYKRHAGLQRALASRNRPRGHRYADQGRRRASRQRRQDPVTISAARSSLSASGHGKRNTAAASSSSRKSSA